MRCLYRRDAMRSPLKTLLRRRVKLFLIMSTTQIECSALEPTKVLSLGVPNTAVIP